MEKLIVKQFTLLIKNTSDKKIEFNLFNDDIPLPKGIVVKIRKRTLKWYTYDKLLKWIKKHGLTVKRQYFVSKSNIDNIFSDQIYYHNKSRKKRDDWKCIIPIIDPYEKGFESMSMEFEMRFSGFESLELKLNPKSDMAYTFYM